MNERDQKILKHVGLYRLSIRAVIEHLYFDGKTCDHVLQRLVDAGRLQRVENALPGGISYYQLSIREARTGTEPVPVNRARNQGTRAVSQALAVLWFACMSERKRRKLDHEQVRKLYGKENVRPHVAEMAPEIGSIIYSVYAPGPDSRDDYLPKRLNRDFAALGVHPELEEWIRLKKLGFAVLVETLKRKEKLERILSSQGPADLPFLVEVVPGPTTLQRAIKEFQRANPS
jgi:hypothetical protein